VKHANPSIWSLHAHPNGQAVSSFKVTKKLTPGTPGAQKLLHRFGDALVCVRHRVTPDGEARSTTVELVLEQVPIRSRAGRLVGVQVGFGEKALQSQVKVAGGIWNPVFRLWKLPLRAARQLGLSDRVRALEE
jgi:hypothetical protein